MKLNFLEFKGNKYQKYINILVVIFSIAMLMLIFNNSNVGKKQENDEAVKEESLSVFEEEESQSYCSELETKMETELSKISGVGKVEVLITMKTKGEVVFNKDVNSIENSVTENDNQGGSRENKDSEKTENTVLIKDTNGGEMPIVIKEYLPEVSGVLIIAEGGGNIEIKSDLINAAKVLLDLPVHKIEVMKMIKN